MDVTAGAVSPYTLSELPQPSTGAIQKYSRTLLLKLPSLKSFICVPASAYETECVAPSEVVHSRNRSPITSLSFSRMRKRVSTNGA